MANVTDLIFQVCGFRDEKCDYTLVIIAAALAVVLVAMLMAAYMIRRCLYDIYSSNNSTNNR